MGWGPKRSILLRACIQYMLILFSASFRQGIDIEQCFEPDVAYEMLALHRNVILHHDQTWCLVTIHHDLSSKGH